MNVWQPLHLPPAHLFFNGDMEKGLLILVLVRGSLNLEAWM